MPPDECIGPSAVAVSLDRVAIGLAARPVQFVDPWLGVAKAVELGTVLGRRLGFWRERERERDNYGFQEMLWSIKAAILLAVSFN